METQKRKETPGVQSPLDATEAEGQSLARGRVGAPKTSTLRAYLKREWKESLITFIESL